MLYTFSENNSGGSWWLERADYDALRAAGWQEPVAIDGPFAAYFDEPGVPYAWRHGWTLECESIRAAVENWEKATGREFFEQGCNCCGAPYSISGSDGDKWEHISGDDAEQRPVRPW
jgi:hypothetical protein